MASSSPTESNDPSVHQTQSWEGTEGVGDSKLLEASTDTDNGAQLVASSDIAARGATEALQGVSGEDSARDDDEHRQDMDDDAGAGLTFDDLKAAVEDLDDTLDEAVGQAADSFWNFAASVTGKVSSVVKEQPGLDSLRKNVTSRLAPLDNIGRDLQNQIGSFAPDEKSIANIAGSVRNVAQSVQRNAQAMEKAILAKANSDGDADRAVPTNEETDIAVEIAAGDPTANVLPMMGATDVNLNVNEEIAKVGEKITSSLEQTVGGLWTGLWGGEEDEDYTEVDRRLASNPPKTRFEKRIFELQANPDTYCEPAKDLDAFEEWSRDFNLDEHTNPCMELLYTHGSIAELYERVVPDVVDEDTFWMRYFYAKHVLDIEEERRKKLLERAANAVEQANDEDDGWGDDDWGDDSQKKTEGGGPSSRDVSGNDGQSLQMQDASDGISSPTKQTDAQKETDTRESNDEKGTQEKKTIERRSPVSPVADASLQTAPDDDWGDDDWE